MTDQEINRKVAELRGFTCEVEPGYWPNESEVWRDKNGYKVGNGDLPNVCNDPAAWGALFVALSGEGLEPRLQNYADGETLAVLNRLDSLLNRRSTAIANSPGKALALVYLASRDVIK